MSRLIKQFSAFFAIALLLTSIVVVIGNSSSGRFASAQFSINHPPLPDPKTVTTNENTPTEITLTGTDPDPGDTITFTISDRPFHGTISVGSTPNSIIYTPMTGYVGPDAFTYTATDNHGFARTKAVVSITVNASTTNPPPPPQTCPQGQHWDDILQKCVPDTTGLNTDVFGIQKIYGDDTRGPRNNWHLTSANDPRFFEQKPIGPDSNGYYTYPSLSQGRIEVLSDPSANEKTIPTFDVNKVIDKGYLYKPVDSPDGKGDWGDIEVTVRYADVKLGSGSYEAHPEIVPGGYRQTSDTTKVGADKAVIAQCEAMSYHSNWYSQSHRVKYEKDSRHTGGYTVDSSDPQTTTATSPYEGKSDPGVIHKFIIYRVPDPSVRGGFAMKLETYVDETGSGKSFKKVLETLDNGKWGPTRSGNSACDASEYVVLNMARVAIGIRVDFMKSFKWKDWSIRSIDPSKKLI